MNSSIRNWFVVVLTPPRSLTQLLERCRRGWGLRPGCVIIGERLSSDLVTFQALEERPCVGLFRYNKQLKLSNLREFSSQQLDIRRLNGHFVEPGAGPRKITPMSKGGSF